jgi:hypothetical protein
MILAKLTLNGMVTQVSWASLSQLIVWVYIAWLTIPMQGSQRVVSYSFIQVCKDS